jgi:hypothetical protein
MAALFLMSLATDFQTFFKRETVLIHVGLKVGDFFASTVFWLAVAVINSRYDTVHLNQSQIFQAVLIL